MENRTFYDRVSGIYDLLANSSERRCRQLGVSLLRVAWGERILEIGAGTGHGLAALGAAAGSAGAVVGVDLSAGMLAAARRTLANAGSSRIALTLADARALCFLDCSFDAAFMSFTLELFETAGLAAVLAEVRRVLRPHGRLGVVAMAETRHSGRMVGVYTRLHRRFPRIVDCRPIDVTGVLQRSGFSITRVRPMTIWGLSVLCVACSM